jgi:uncharacterized membrane protein YeaQ/YmgE (transglycosylase-associated protein family)
MLAGYHIVALWATVGLISGWLSRRLHPANRMGWISVTGLTLSAAALALVILHILSAGGFYNPYMPPFSA